MMRTLAQMWASLSPWHRLIAKFIGVVYVGALALLLALGSYGNAAFGFVALTLMLILLARMMVQGAK